MDRCHHSFTMYMNDEKTPVEIDNKMFNRLVHINGQLYEVQLAKSEIKLEKKLVIVLQYASLRMLELCFNFVTKFFETDKYEKMERHTNLLYLGLADKKLCDCTRSEKRHEWELFRSKICNDSFTADACSKFFPRTFCAAHKKRVEREPGLFKENV